MPASPATNTVSFMTSQETCIKPSKLKEINDSNLQMLAFCKCGRPKMLRDLFIFLIVFHLAVLGAYYFIVKITAIHPRPNQKQEDSIDINGIIWNSTWLTSQVTEIEVPFPYIYLLNVPNACSSGKVGLVVTVITSPGHVKHRSAIRETWGKEFGNETSVVLFFMGHSRVAKIQSMVKTEFGKYGDIIQSDYTDSYKNLSIKSFSVLNWVTTYCPGAKFVFKVDDDVYVNVPVLIRTLSTYNDQPAVYGYLAHKWKPFRNPKNKYYISLKAFPFKYYPDFVAGPAYIVSRDAVPILLYVGLKMKPFILEDVFLTGLVALEAGVPRINQSGIKSSRDKFKPCKFNETIMSHGHNPIQLLKFWKRTHSPGFVCRT